MKRNMVLPLKPIRENSGEAEKREDMPAHNMPCQCKAARANTMTGSLD